MIVREKRSWLQLLFAWRGSSVTITWWRVVFVTVISIIVTVAERFLNTGEGVRVGSGPLTMIGLALGIVLGFRTNQCYDRFWEGRKLWGRLVNVARTTARQAHTFLQADSPEEEEAVQAFRREVVYRTIAYVHAVRHHLRDTDGYEELTEFLSEEELASLASQQNVPAYLLRNFGQRLRWAWQQGWLREFHLPVFDESLTEMFSIQGGCERIRATPVPFPYTVLIHRLVAFYCLFLPFALVTELGLLTPVVVFLLSYAFFGLDDIGDELEEPFGFAPNDLPLCAISTTIEINLLQMLDEDDLPEPLKPVNGFLH